MTPQRKHLKTYGNELKEIEFAELAIHICERISDPAGARCVAQLKRAQQRILKRLDAAAAKLGAPYEGQ